MISTVSRESAPKSTNLASAATASSSVPSCSEMMLRTLSSVSWLCARDGANQTPPQSVIPRRMHASAIAASRPSRVSLARYPKRSNA